MTQEQIKTYNDIINTFPETKDEKRALLKSVQSLRDELLESPDKNALNVKLVIQKLNLFILMIQRDLDSKSQVQE